MSTVKGTFMENIFRKDLEGVNVKIDYSGLWDVLEQKNISRKEFRCKIKLGCLIE